jgi:Gamma-glutamyl cyclotransferase, AIG2-like
MSAIGEIYALNSERASRTWRVLDNYERCAKPDHEPHVFRRQKVDVLLSDGQELDAWAYILAELPTTEAVRVPGGNYVAWHRQKHGP